MYKKMKKRPLALALGIVMSLAGVQALAEDTMYAANKVSGPSSNVAWDPETVRFVANGNPERGAEINKKMSCAMCHGEKGISMGRNWPHLAGQQAEYTYKMLMDYHDEKRVDADSAEVMVKLAQKMSRQDMADVAAYYASLPLSSDTPAKLADQAQVEQVKTLLIDGDGKRLIPPCLSCHGMKGEGNGKDMAAIAGQRPEYFRKTMLDFKHGVRHNDIYARMRYIAQALSDEEINALAQYLADFNKPAKKSAK